MEGRTTTCWEDLPRELRGYIFWIKRILTLDDRIWGPYFRHLASRRVGMRLRRLSKTQEYNLLYEAKKYGSLLNFYLHCCTGRATT